MKVSTADRLKQIMSERNLKQIDIVNMAKPYCNEYNVRLGRNDLSQYVSGKVEPGQHKLYILAKALNVNEAWLMGYDVPMEREDITKSIDIFPHPNVTEDYVTFPVIGEIAAGYDCIATETWEGDTVDIPTSQLYGHPETDFFVLSVKGDSMYPLYHDGDIVLILRQSTLNASGDIGAVIYDDEIATLKKVEYVYGEDWMRLVPINPNIPPIMIEGKRLEHCRVLGIPKLLIRKIGN